MQRQGYSATRYQGDKAVFNAQTHTLQLNGKKAGVNRDQTVLVGDSIVFNDSTKIVVARGDTVILRDPQQQAADVIARGRMAYNVELHRGVVDNISTEITEGEHWFVGGKTAAFVSDTTRGRETAFYVRNGTITSCDDSIPDYHFRANEIKMISKNIMVARPAVLYIVATVSLARGDAASRRVATVAISIELAGVITVGAASELFPSAFPDATVWTGFGSGYGFVPLVLPFVGLWWLRHTR